MPILLEILLTILAIVVEIFVPEIRCSWHLDPPEICAQPTPFTIEPTPIPTITILPSTSAPPTAKPTEMLELRLYDDFNQFDRRLWIIDPIQNNALRVDNGYLCISNLHGMLHLRPKKKEKLLAIFINLQENTRSNNNGEIELGVLVGCQPGRTFSVGFVIDDDQIEILNEEHAISRTFILSQPYNLGVDLRDGQVRMWIDSKVVYTYYQELRGCDTIQEWQISFFNIDSAFLDDVWVYP